ncbi:undecaprenyl-diphosphate phosphatase [Methylacidimicrobium sp. B4]|uniref:undecaprenyl-diphosphate phosphatase n=1 Tax=Methylacidimicrobium sp. B4 TaxID=2796139 RepID=UPI001A8EEBCE|nr:undecaprenyl-diphosphate phosphatase [Methylacidimicrobium sp. B4]QSR84620.1 undecaprenyl-diphosphate phosphatase [Methylacidimicrobium sp. B4]
MNDFLTSTILGVVEGLTEFLPVSSTGHLLITEHWLGARSETFNIFIQLGAVLAVTLLYWPKIVGLITGIHKPQNLDYVLKLAVAFALTSVLGLAAKKAGWKLPDQLTPVLLAVFAGAAWIFLAESRLRSLEPTSQIGWMTACAVGVAQVLAGVFPGLSRSGATILTALLFGVERPAATEFAFLLGIPTMFAASLFSFAQETHFFRDLPADSWDTLLVGFTVSGITGFAAVQWLLRYVQSHTFIPFAWYRLALGAALVGLLSLPWKS